MPNYAAPKVTKIEFLDGMKIKLFYDGKTKIVDIGGDSDLPERFPKLKQKEFFQKAVIDGGSIRWDDLHVDLDEIIYEFPDATEKLPATGSYCKKVNSALEKVKS